MATRQDVDIDFIPSPRVATVQDPSTEFIAQDVVDTLRIGEESWRGQTENKLMNASGKEDLGGGVAVGITVALQDTQIAFESRTTPAQVGIVTTASNPPVNNLIDLHDTSASYQTNLVTRGSLVINFADQSIAEVYRVESETHLVTRTPVNGTDNSFDLNDDYQIFNVIQCEISGGNVVAVDEIGDELSPVLPTAFTQIVRTSSSSATLQNQTTLEYSTYDGGVHIDVDNGVAGTTGLIGNESDPVNNLADAKTIADFRGFKQLYIREIVPVGASESITGYKVKGEGPSISVLSVEAGATTGDVSYEDLCIIGVISGAGFFDNCHIETTSGLGCTTADSYLRNCVFRDATLTIRADNTMNISIINTGQGDASGVPILDLNNSVGSVSISGWGGQLIIKNSGGAVIFGGDSAHLIIDASCNAGSFMVHGAVRLEDNSGAGCAVMDHTTYTQNENTITIIAEVLKYSKNRTKIDATAFTLTVYDDDGTTPLEVFDLKDENGVASITSIFERIPQ